MSFKVMSVRRRDLGFTLTEIAIVLGVAGILLGAIWVAAANVMATSNANQAAQDIMTIAANVRSTFSAAASFSDSNTDEVGSGKFISAGIIPSALVTGATTAINVWNGNVKVWENPGGFNNRIFRVSYYHTPQDVCYRIASTLANIGTGDAPVTLITNSGAFSYNIPNSGATVGLSSADISTACAQNAVLATASTEFDFTIH